MGRVAADHIVARVAAGASQAAEPAVLRFSGRLVVRGSTAPPSG
jgi:DNA-binding LacI/PurR family transcriptional regulator